MLQCKKAEFSDAKSNIVILLHCFAFVLALILGHRPL